MKFIVYVIKPWCQQIQISLCIHAYMSAKLVHGDHRLPHCQSKDMKPTFHLILGKYQVRLRCYFGIVIMGLVIVFNKRQNV